MVKLHPLSDLIICVVNQIVPLEHHWIVMLNGLEQPINTMDIYILPRHCIMVAAIMTMLNMYIRQQQFHKIPEYIQVCMHLQVRQALAVEEVPLMVHILLMFIKQVIIARLQIKEVIT